MTQDYDVIPYESTPITDAHPYKLAVLGRLFGLQPPAPSSARVLELGCAEGGTLIPLAMLFPQAQFVGLELSQVQTDAGNTLIDSLGLQNVRIQQADILAAGSELGNFDYIFSHGVYSWVPAPVQDKMLALCRDLLTPNGLAYISYNVNPGWRLRGAIRDMFAFHLRGESRPKRKLQAAYELIEMLQSGLQDSPTLMSQYLRSELDYLSKARPAYLYHEYLEPVNAPILFSDFVAHADKHKLRYVCDIELYSMFPSSFGASAQTMLDQFVDIQTTEQYADFLRMRTFRQSILCRHEKIPTYDLDLGTLDEFAAYSNLLPAKTPDLRHARADEFVTAIGKRVSLSHPLTKASMLLLAEIFPNAISLPELLQQAQQKLRANKAEKLANEVNSWRGEMFNLLANNIVGFTTESRTFATSRGSLRATALARQQAKREDGFVSTIWSEVLAIDPFAAQLLEMLDGQHNKASIIESLHKQIAQGKIQPAGNEKGKSASVSRDSVERNVDRLLTLFAQNGVLEPVQR